MVLHCPECMGPLEIVDDRRVRCSIHGGQYALLFSRQPLAASSAESPAPHSAPHSAAPHSAARPSAQPAGIGKPLPSEERRPSTEQGPAMERECANHPGSAAVRACWGCRAAICETCSFKFPGGVFMCPSCAASPPDPGKSKRAKYLIGSFVCAGLGTLFFVLMLCVATLLGSEAEAMLWGIIMMFGILSLTIPGAALSTCARAPGRSTSAWVWVALSWNLLLIGMYLLLCLVGSLMGG